MEIVIKINKESYDLIQNANAEFVRSRLDVISDITQGIKNGTVICMDADDNREIKVTRVGEARHGGKWFEQVAHDMYWEFIFNRKDREREYTQAELENWLQMSVNPRLLKVLKVHLQKNNHNLNVRIIESNNKMILSI